MTSNPEHETSAVAWTNADNEAFLRELLTSPAGAQLHYQNWATLQNPLVQELYRLGWTLALKIERGALHGYAYRRTPSGRDETPEFKCVLDGPEDALDRILTAVLGYTRAADCPHHHTRH